MKKKLFEKRRLVFGVAIGTLLIAVMIPSVMAQPPRPDRDWNYWTNPPDIFYFRPGNVGNAGIGTTTPQSKLDVHGDIRVTNPADSTDYLLVSPGDTWTSLNHFWNGGTIGTVMLDYSGTLSAEDLSSFFGLEAQTGDVIVNLGDVGIGTTTPQSRLDAHGDIRVTNPADSTDYLLVSPGDTATMLNHFWNGGTIGTVTIDYSGTLSAEHLWSWFGLEAETGNVIVKLGNVGIGTTSPTARLEAHSTTTDTAVFGNSTTMTAEGVVGRGSTGVHGIGYTGVYGEGDVGVKGNGIIGVYGESTVSDAGFFDGTLHVDGPLSLDPITAPGAPLTGFVLYCDAADGKLKAKASTGTVTVLANP